MTPPIIIVTGFLGSGKTTLLRRMLESGLGGRRAALIVNEIGEVGFDGQALEGVHAGRMIELTSGCICCSVGTDFLLAVEELVETVAPELIVVESTGLAEPWNLIRQVHRSGLPLDAVITLVDAANVERALALSPVADGQIRAADFLVLNKCDLASPEALAHVHGLLRALNVRAAIFKAVRGAVDAGLLFGTSMLDAESRPSDDASASSAVAGRHDHLHQDDIATLLWESDTPLERQKLAAALRELPPQVYRAKGIVHCTEAPWPLRVNAVCGRCDYESTRLKEPPPRLNRLVLLGAGLRELQSAIQARLNACADTPERAASWLERSQESGVRIPPPDS